MRVAIAGAGKVGRSIAAELTEVSGTSSHCPDCGAVAGSWSAPPPLVAPCTTATSRARRTWSGNWAVHRV